MVQHGHQGDTQWYLINEVPGGAKKIEKKFIAASERSGSSHALYGEYDLYETEGGFCVDVKEDCVLNHSLDGELGDSLDKVALLKDKDHRKGVIKKGIYLVGIQRRFNPMEGYLEQVKD
jgi:hypothetical protein